MFHNILDRQETGEGKKWNEEKGELESWQLSVRLFFFPFLPF